MEDSKKKINVWDILVKIVLIAIIIILLVHNCSTMNKLKGNDNGVTQTPTGNIDIFEIQCERETCKDVLGDQKENPKPTPTVTPGDNTGTGTTTTPAKDNTNTGNNNNNNNNNTNTGNNENPGGNENQGGEELPDADLTVMDTVEWKSQNELKIFTNTVYQMDQKIAPESSNTYEFIVRNNTSMNVKYKIDFTEENSKHINMKYRLKRSNQYVKGSATEWVTYDELNLDETLLNSRDDHIYYLEWKWFSSDNDTAVGADPTSTYKLNIVISAESQNA